MREIIQVWVKVMAVIRADNQIKILVPWIVIPTPALRLQRKEVWTHKLSELLEVSQVSKADKTSFRSCPN